MKKIAADIITFLIRLVGKLPKGFHYAVASCLSWLLNHVFHYRKDVVMTNLARSFPDRKYDELRQISDKFYRHLGDILAEAVMFGACTDYRKLEKRQFCTFAGREEDNEALMNPNGTMILTAHCGNWEIIGGIIGYVGKHTPLVEKDTCVVYKKLSSPVMDIVMKRNRTAPLDDKEFEGVIESSDVLRYMLRHRGERKFYCFPTDQFPYRNASRHEVGDFMHQKTMTMTGGAALACKLGMSVVFLKFDKVARGRYTMSFEPICNDASTMSVDEIMNRFYGLLQEEIESRPWNYLWSHKRWK